MKTAKEMRFVFPFIAILFAGAACLGGDATAEVEIERAKGVLEMLKGKTRAVTGKEGSLFAAQLDKIARDKMLFKVFRSKLATRVKHFGVSKTLDDVFRENSVESIKKAEKFLSVFVQVETEKMGLGYINCANLLHTDARNKPQWITEKAGWNAERVFGLTEDTPFFKMKPDPGVTPSGTLRAQSGIILPVTTMHELDQWHLPFPICVVFGRCD